MPQGEQLSLTAIPGIGERLAETLRQALGGEEEALKALLEGDMPRLAEALGSERRALRLIRSARAAAAGYSADEVAATQDAAEILARSLEAIASYASSKPARAEILAATPAPSHAVAAAAARYQAATRLSPSLPEEEAAALPRVLSRLTWPTRRPRARRLVLAPPERLQELRRLLAGVENARIVKTSLEPGEIEQYSFDDIVVYDPDHVLGDDAPTARRPLPAQVAPEAVLDLVAANSAIIEAGIEAARVAPTGFAAASKLHGVDAGRLVEALQRLHEIHSRYREGRLGSEYERLRGILNRLEGVVGDLEVWLNEEAKKRLEKLELRLTAAELLRLIDMMEAGEIRIPDSVAEVFEELALEAENRLAEQLGLTPEEASLIAGLVEPRPALPLEIRREPVEALRASLSRRAAVARLRALQALAEEAQKHLWAIDTAYRVLLGLDLATAFHRYTASFGGGCVAIEPNSLGVGVVEGREIELAAKTGPERVQPVSYSIGCTSYRPEGTSCERIILLTGANSGGKTTLLRLIAETVLLSQSGLPAPAARTHLGPFDRVYYISKPTGMLSAGALETLLRRLAWIASQAASHRVLVLVDELEAVTEANAAARIIAAFIEELLGNKAVAVIVTHMAEDIVSLLGRPKELRIDGIEARGLDENYNLIVDRSPRYNYLARSTPELVVRRLINRSRSAREREFYEKIFQRLQR
jgi:DNA mismatch repair protein MutS2